MSRRFALLLLPTLATMACNDDELPDTDETEETDVAPLEEPCTGFAAEPMRWPVAKGFVYDYTMNTRDGIGDYWNLVDLDGDGFLDLVETRHGSKAAGDEMGEAWYVWWGDGSQFSQRAVFSLPFDHREIEGLAAANDVERVLDINGDGVQDLVLAQNPETRDVWDADGDAHWRVYLGTGRGGFSDTPTAWGLPDRIDGQVHSARSNAKAWTTTDLDGDGQVEIVHHRDPDTGGNYGFAAGSPHWKVFAADGTAFEDAPSDWAIAESPNGRDGFYDMHTDGGHFTTRTQDINGDGLPDLISPRHPGWPYPVWGTEDEPHWRVFLNTGSGFDREAVEWSIPDGRFDFPSSSGDWTLERSTRWDTLAIGGALPSLVVTQDPTTEEGFTDTDGEPVWHVYRSRGEGFEADPHLWRVPDPVYTSLYATGGGATEGWTTVDLTGDGCLDLVHTAGLAHGVPEDPGASWSWLVYPGE